VCAWVAEQIRSLLVESGLMYEWSLFNEAAFIENVTMFVMATKDTTQLNLMSLVRINETQLEHGIYPLI
jgi:putative salt-induced outer membrane protein YdiY